MYTKTLARSKTYTRTLKDDTNPKNTLAKTEYLTDKTFRFDFSGPGSNRWLDTIFLKKGEWGVE